MTAELWRLPNRLGGYAYAQWMAPTGTGRRPAVILTRPYDGIVWSGEEVDARWAGRPGAAAGYQHPDDEEPSFGANSSSIAYRLTQPQDVAAEANVYLFNQVGVLAVFGRFYAGGSMENDAEDMAAGLHFLHSNPRVDPARVGITGGSWGGFNALYGALHAQPGEKPAVGVALFPAADFEALMQWAETGVHQVVTLPSRDAEFRAFYEPYLRRMKATVGNGAAADFTGWRADDLAQRANLPWLVVHDEWDQLIPFEQSVALVARSGGLVEPLWYLNAQPVNRDTAPLDHGVFLSASVMKAYDTFAAAFLQVRLEDPQRMLSVAYARGDLSAYLQHIRAAQQRGEDVDFVVPRLLDLCDARVQMVDLSPVDALPVMSGRDLVAAGLNLHWGTAFDGAAVVNQLTQNGLPP